MLGRLRLALSVAASALLFLFLHAAIPASGAEDASDELNPREAAAKMERLFDDVAKADRELPRDSFDLATIIGQAGREPQKLFEFVRDHTYWVPYQGALRGAAGVLSDRLGSSLDRSLLLADALRSAGHKVRLAHAVLDEASARKLIAAMRPVPGEIVGAVAGANPEAQKTIEDLATKLEPALAAPPPSSADQHLADARDHWWVQVQTGAGWTDADVAMPDAKLGQKLTAAAETFAVDKGDVALPVPAPFTHQVIIRVLIERWEKGALAEKPVMEATVQPATLRESPILLRHIPLPVSRSRTAASQQQMRAALLAQNQWMPVLTIKGRNFMKYSFGEAGEIAEKPQLSGPAAVGRAAGGMMGGMGGMLGGGDDGPKATSVLTAEWLEFEIRAPGRQPHIVRREIFDMIGPAARAGKIASMPRYNDDRRMGRALALAGGIESLMISSRPTKDGFLHLLYEGQLSQRQLWRKIVAERDVKKQRELMQTLTGPSSLHAYAIGRHVLSPAKLEAYIDSVNIINQRLCYAVDEKRQIVESRIIDVVANDVAVRDGASAVARLRQGIADTAAERLCLTTSTPSLQNTHSLFTSPLPTGSKLITLRNAKDPAIGRLAIAADVKARISTELAAGYAIVMYDRPWTIDRAKRTTWWRVHPATGQTIGVMDSGYHAATKEYGEVTEIVSISEADLEVTVVGKTQICYRGGMTAAEFWSQGTMDICRQLGYAMTRENIAELVQIQARVMAQALRAGIH